MITSTSVDYGIDKKKKLLILVLSIALGVCALEIVAYILGPLFVYNRSYYQYISRQVVLKNSDLTSALCKEEIQTRYNTLIYSKCREGELVSIRVNNENGTLVYVLTYKTLIPTLPTRLLVFLIVPIAFYALELFFVHKLRRTGLLVLAWIGIILTVLAAILLALILVYEVTNDSRMFPTKPRRFSIFDTIVFAVGVILSIVILVLTFKLVNLLKRNNDQVVQAVELL